MAFSAQGALWAVGRDLFPRRYEPRPGSATFNAASVLFWVPCWYKYLWWPQCLVRVLALHHKSVQTFTPKKILNYDPNQSFSFLWIKHWGPTLFDKGFNLHSFFSSFWLWRNWTALLFLHRHLGFDALVSRRRKCSAFYFQQFTSWICRRLFWPESTLLEKKRIQQQLYFWCHPFFSDLICRWIFVRAFVGAFVWPPISWSAPTLAKDSSIACLFCICAGRKEEVV